MKVIMKVIKANVNEKKAKSNNRLSKEKMLNSYEELPTGLGCVGAVEVSINFDYKVAIIKMHFPIQCDSI